MNEDALASPVLDTRVDAEAVEGAAHPCPGTGCGNGGMAGDTIGRGGGRRTRLAAGGQRQHQYEREPQPHPRHSISRWPAIDSRRMAQHPVDLEHPNPSVEQVQAELETVLRSPGFERAEKLQRFLRFICTLTLQGESQRINEYLIGSEVFQRGPGYNPTEDSIVRRQAHALRHRLQEYYAGEGQGHAVRIELPVGRYVPAFRRIEEQQAAVPKPEPEPPSPAPVPAPAAAEPRRLPQALLWAGAAAAALAVFAAGWALGSRGGNVSAAPWGPATREIWGPWQGLTEGVTICFSTSMNAVIKHFERELPETLIPRRQRASANEERAYREAFRLPAGGHLYFTPVVNQTKASESIAGVLLTALFTRAGITVHTSVSRFLDWDDLRKSNYILLGHNEANPLVLPLLKDKPFGLLETAEGRQRGIWNRQPRPGESAEYRIAYSKGDNEGNQEYALVSMIPGVTGKRLLLISGLNSQATQVATEFLTSEESLALLLGRLRQQAPRHRGPWHFQAVMKTEVFDNVPTRATLVTARVVEP